MVRADPGVRSVRRGAQGILTMACRGSSERTGVSGGRGGMGALQSLDVCPGNSREELLQALRTNPDTNVLPFNSSQPHTQVPPLDKWDARRMKRWLVPSTLVVGISLVAILVWLQVNLDSTTYSTARGEQHSIVLPDSSVVQLNTLSTLRISFDRHRRRVELIRGEAFFRVAHDRSRPFEVQTRFATVRAVGTEFNIYNRDGGTQIAVIEGKVHVEAIPVQGTAATTPSDLHTSQANGSAIVALAAGQQITVSAAGPRQLLSATTSATTAWIQRRIVLDNDRIDTAVAEFNRYNKKQMRVQSADLAELRISGTFDATMPMPWSCTWERVQGVLTSDVDGQLVLRR